MKAILTETVLLSATIMFWAVALPAAVVVFPAIAVGTTIRAALVGGVAGPRGRLSPIATWQPRTAHL